MRRKRRRAAAMALGVMLSMTGAAGMAQVWETFDGPGAAQWDYVADGVMGGVSRGGARLEEGALRLTGEVSTANNGGFIQVRRRFDGGWPEGTDGLRLRVRGNGERYFVFLRTTGLSRVWQSYRASFVTTEDWSEVSLALADFRPSHDGMRAVFAPGDVISIGILAYGRDHRADVSLREISLY
ncbi:CIA30 family protein [Gymnodinialimonas ulvae]|uniref:CIA30 family protein n=1 Tax=Gymnodinialimonas ulvae TaxID=3126504 RepID=UPI0030B45FEB